MAKKANKFYAVRCGRVPGVYTSWEDCKKQVYGFGGASYKGFLTEAEAEAFVRGGNISPAGETSPIAEESPAEAVAYVDGSYSPSDGRYSFGAVIITGGEELYFKQAFDRDEAASMRNVAGEIEGAKFAMGYCVEHNIPSVDIFYDYSGIECWCTGEWRTNNPHTQSYKAYFDKVKQTLSVRFKKVRGHSGDKYNDIADSLAKSALGI